MHKPSLTSAILGCFVLLTASEAHASGFATARFGGEHGNPVTNNPTAMYYNPAGLAESEGIHLFLDGNLALRGATFSKTGSTEPPDAQGANNGEATLFNVVAAPMIGASAKFGSLALGLGAYVPFGGTAVWDKNEKFEGNAKYPGPVDGVQRWYSIEGTIQSIYITAAAAYEIGPVSVGLSGNLIRSRISTIRAREPAGTDDLEAPEGRSEVDVGDWNGSFGVGVMVEPLPKKLWIGASYQAQPGLGEMRLDGTLRNNFGGSVDTVEVDVVQALPDVIRLGARFRPIDDLELRLFADYTRWSVLENQCLANEDQPCTVDAETGLATSNPPPLQNLPRHWNDSVGIRAGLSLWVMPDVELFTGMGYDGNAIPDETLEPALTDFHKISGALGGRLKVNDHFAAALSYTHLFYVPRDTTGKFEPSQYGGITNPSRGPDAGGRYSQWIGVINANVDISF